MFQVLGSIYALIIVLYLFSKKGLCLLFQMIKLRLREVK